MTVHSNEVPACTKPWPLQAFWPLHALLAPLQALCPLQALPPAQTTWAEAAVAKVLTANTAAAVANMVRLVIDFSLSLDAMRKHGKRSSKGVALHLAFRAPRRVRYITLPPLPVHSPALAASLQ